MSTSPDLKLSPVAKLNWLAPYAVWVLLYACASVWFLSGRTLAPFFSAILYYDIIVSVLTPLIIVPLILLAVVWAGRSIVRSLRMVAAAVMFVGMSVLFLWVSAAILYHHGGMSFLWAIPVLAGKINWRVFFSPGRDRGVQLLLARSMLSPLVCFAPALLIGCLVFRRNTLDNGSSDWVGLFGIVYFTAQAGLDYLLMRFRSRFTDK